MNPPVDLSSFHLLHDVFRIRAKDPVQIPLLAFPAHVDADFEYFTGKDLDRFTDKAAWYYSKAIRALSSSQTVALLGPTNLEWVISTFGLSRAGLTILTLSPRLSCQAMVKLMQETDCASLIYYPSAQLVPIVDQVKAAMAVATIPMMPRADFEIIDTQPQAFMREVDVEAEKHCYAAIVHSSGSSGLPKPIYCKHTRFTTPYPIGSGDRDLFTLPLYHIFAFQISFAHMYQRKTAFFLNPNRPVTCKGLTAAIQAAKPSTLCAVPYTLKLLREQQSGIEALKSCGQVVFTGSQCPDDLGDFLVGQGVNLATFMGATECGFTGSSIQRPPEDKAWNYIRIPPALMEYIWPKPVSKDVFEFVYLKEYPTRTVTNSDDPPDSFHSSDLFVPHSVIPAAWKYLGRLDDRITLNNGEKVLPLPIEGQIRKAALVKEAVVFGIGRPIPGLLLFRAEDARGLGDEAFVSRVWPDIEKSNELAEGFSKITRNMVVPLPFAIELPVTDKGSIIRAQSYTIFKREIDHAYARLEGDAEGTTKLDLPELEKYLLRLAQQIVGPQLIDIRDDLFSHGMNSLQAIQIRGNIVQDLDLGGNGKQLSHNVVFDQGNLENLSKYIHALRLNLDVGKEKPIEAMRDLISRFSNLRPTKPRQGSRDQSRKNVVVITGATGGLGAHVLAQLLEQPEVTEIVCLLRDPDPLSRLQQKFKDRHLDLSNDSKLSVLPSDLSSPKLGLTDPTYQGLLSKVTHIIHCAWPVTFQLALGAFESSIQGVHNLLQLSLDVDLATPARFLFCSSISTALGDCPGGHNAEAPIENLEQTSLTGYAQSKLVSEWIVQAAVEKAGAAASILRIGQIVGDTKTGWWNDSEMFPLIIRSALNMGILPELGPACEWLPVDTLAEGIIQIAHLDARAAEEPDLSPGRLPSSQGERHLVYNLVSPHKISWTTEILPALSSAGLSFRPVSLVTWVHQLRSLSLLDSSHNSDDNEDGASLPVAADPTQNPALKLIDFFEGIFLAGNAAGKQEIDFDTAKAREAAAALRQAPHVVTSGLLAKMLEAWMKKWRKD